MNSSFMSLLSWMQKVKRTIMMSSSLINISTNHNTASICHVMGKSQGHEHGGWQRQCSFPGEPMDQRYAL
jgi:hypothetical protein